MNLEYVLSFKNNKELQFFDKKILNNIYTNFKKSKIRFRNKKIKKKTSNILKNRKIQIDKKKIENRVTLYLNKISKDNINVIIKEFIEDIGIITEEKYELVQKTFFFKVITEINFLDNYLNFFLIIFSIYKQKFNFNPYFFINIIQKKIEFDYIGNYDNINEKLFFLNNFKDENFRLANLDLIKSLININFFDKKLTKFINNILINQNEIPDICNWYQNYNFNNSEENKIRNMLNDKISFRYIVLLRNLLGEGTDNDLINNYTNNDTNNDVNNDTDNDVNNDTDNDVNNDTDNDVNNDANNDVKKENNNIEYINIYEEYLYLEIIDEVKEYIKSDCKNAKEKNIFSMIGIIFYIKEKLDENANKILRLFSKLIEEKILFKSNLSRGLIILLKKNKKYDDKKIAKFLLFLKSKGITRNIEHIYKKYKIF